jgi:hypothetical protein
VARPKSLGGLRVLHLGAFVCALHLSGYGKFAHHLIMPAENWKRLALMLIDYSLQHQRILRLDMAPRYHFGTMLGQRNQAKRLGA